MSNRTLTAAGPSSTTTRSERAIRRGAKALLSSDSRVLLVRERHEDDGETFWTLPGGGVHPRESVTDALRRECAEELDCGVVVGDPLTEFWYAHRSSPSALTGYAVFDCSLVTDIAPARSEGVLESRWVDPTNPPATTIPQVTHLLEDHGPRRCDAGASNR